MARLLNTDGSETAVTPRNTRAGFTLEELYRLLSCEMAQVIPLADGSLLVADEEGKFKHPAQPINKAATELLRLAGGIPGDFVVGDALVCSRKELK